MLNPIEIKHAIAGQPYRLSRKVTGGDFWQVDNDAEMLTMLMGVGYTAGLNLAAPLALIQSGATGNRYLSHTSVGYSKIGYPMPMFNYVTPGSRASRIGARAGGKIGARVGARLIPGVGWALLAYDVYDVAINRSLWGFDLS